MKSFKLALLACAFNCCITSALFAYLVPPVFKMTTAFRVPSDDESDRAKIEQALKTATTNGYLLRDVRDRTLVQAFFQVDKPPANMAFDVSLRHGDRVWPVGPFAWKNGKIKSWAYDVDLPLSITQLDVVFTPSKRAGRIIKGLGPIWLGEPLVYKVNIRTHDVQMLAEAPPQPEEIKEHLVDAFPLDSEVAGLLTEGKSFDQLRTHLESKTHDSQTNFELGCVLLAQDELEKAFAKLVEVRNDRKLAQRVQRELRYICARWSYEAQRDGVQEMVSLAKAYQLGQGVGQDLRDAKYWYRKAANAGHAEAAKYLSKLLAKTPDTQGSIEQALKGYRAQVEVWNKPVVGSYDDWIKKHVLGFRGILGPDEFKQGLKLVITSFNHEEDDMRKTSSGVRLSNNNMRHWFYHSSRGSRGGGGSEPLSAETMQTIDRLLSELPEDRNILPPPNRRILIELINKEKTKAWAFDRANLPRKVSELLQTINCGQAFVPSFKSHASLDVRGFEHGGLLAVTPQNEILFTGGDNDLIQWRDSITREFLAEAKIRQPNAIAFHKDGRHALLESFYDTYLVDLQDKSILKTFKSRFGATFTPNHQFVVLRATRKQPALVLDTSTWEPTSRPSSIPDDWVEFFPSKTNRRIVACRTDGSVVLWDAAKQVPIKALDSPKDLSTTLAVFSPDETRIALHQYSRSNQDSVKGIQIVDSQTGKTLRTLVPFESGLPSNRVSRLWWTPDGEFLLAAVQTGTGDSICLFNVQTSRHRGLLPGPSRVNGFGYLTESQELVIGGQNGKIWFWHLPDVLESVREFEDSLGP